MLPKVATEREKMRARLRQSDQQLLHRRRLQTLGNLGGEVRSSAKVEKTVIPTDVVKKRWIGNCHSHFIDLKVCRYHHDIREPTT
jgi:hypothetical protein